MAGFDKSDLERSGPSDPVTAYLQRMLEEGKLDQQAFDSMTKIASDMQSDSIDVPFSRTPLQTPSVGGARLASSSGRSSYSRSYQPLYGGYSQRSSTLAVVFRSLFLGMLTGLFFAALLWTARWGLDWTLGWNSARTLMASPGWWIGWPVGMGLVVTIIGVWKNN